MKELQGDDFIELVQNQGYSLFIQKDTCLLSRWWTSERSIFMNRLLEFIYSIEKFYKSSKHMSKTGTFHFELPRDKTFRRCKDFQRRPFQFYLILIRSVDSIETKRNHFKMLKKYTINYQSRLDFCKNLPLPDVIAYGCHQKFGGVCR